MKYLTWEEHDAQEKWRAFKHATVGGLITALIFSLFLILSCTARAAEICEETAIHCILGEARGEGYQAMLGHAEAIRNRGHLKGVYGCRANLSKEMSYLKKSGIYNLAIKAWRESMTSNVTHGADHWGSIKVDGKWIKTMEKNGYIKTAKIGNTIFYRRQFYKEI